MLNVSTYTCLLFVDVLNKIQQSAYVSMNSLLQSARTSKYERDDRQFAMSAYFDYGLL